MLPFPIPPHNGLANAHRAAPAALRLVLPGPARRADLLVAPVPDGRGGLAMPVSRDIEILLALRRTASGDLRQDPDRGVGRRAERRAHAAHGLGEAPEPAAHELQAGHEEFAAFDNPASATPDRLPVIRTRAEALNALRSFEARHHDRLPQWSGGFRDRARLGAGHVTFRTLGEILVCFPCADSLKETPVRYRLGIVPPGAPARNFIAGYAAGTGQWSTPQEASLEGRQVILRQSPGQPTVEYTLDRCHWQPSEVYSDAVVERAKRRMWTRIFRESVALAGLEHRLPERP